MNRSGWLSEVIPGNGVAGIDANQTVSLIPGSKRGNASLRTPDETGERTRTRPIVKSHDGAARVDAKGLRLRAAGRIE